MPGGHILDMAWVLLGVANFYEKALFVKPTWRPLCGERDCSALRAMLLSAVNKLRALRAASRIGLTHLFAGPTQVPWE
jgi:hypothetical protein